MKNIAIVRLVEEGGVNPSTGIKYNSEDMNNKLKEYINNDNKLNYILLHDKSTVKSNGKINIDSFDNLNTELILGKITSFDSKFIYVDFLDEEKYNTYLKIKNPVAIISSIAEYDYNSIVYNIERIVKIEIAEMENVL